MGLSMKERNSVTKEVAERYKNASKNEKIKILNEYIAITGFHRKYAINKINSYIKKRNYSFNNKKMTSIKVIEPKKKKRVYTKEYDEPFQTSLIRIWSYFDYLCGQRLVPFIRENIEALTNEKSFKINETIKEKLLNVSSATINRLINIARNKNKLHGISTTKAGKSLNQLIPIRVFFDGDERIPGFFEMDTVSHDGGNASGEHIYSVTVTDISVGWTEIRPVLNKAQRWVKERIEEIKNELPYKMLGLDSDNGSEFKNYQLYQWAQENEITFTRGRSYKKNDNCFVEQKNNSVVRRLLGYYRYEGEETLILLEKLYKYWCLLINYFYPSVKILEKERKDTRVYKKYDMAKTPYKRCLESNKITNEEKEKLKKIKMSLNIVELKENVEKALNEVLTKAVIFHKILK